ncbi:PREDICTED: pancreatic triacylglycerol lipase-like isoform X2 [Ceratosolen solmsi marchali]|uniref:phospholipase A1 n=1 Tax=Ceratosolen solmsi marchali TaxID=326594 RepID=A0AAJ7DSZ2_9HYME|nr:PREDICTED: pancreatic triacylglycerol lipase-like isoform X2 [Ceratosolen solmsi marchali]
MWLNETLLALIYSVNLLSSTQAARNSRRPHRHSAFGASMTATGTTTLPTTTIIQSLDENKFEYDEEWYMWRCYQPFGCFYIGSPWSGGSRPVSTFPVRPDSINPHFMLYTRQRIDDPHQLIIDDLSTIRNSPLRKRENLYFIIHGYLDNGNKTWVLRMMRELLQHEDANVIVVNWIGGAGPPYTQAVANTRLVGAMTGRLASQLIQRGNILPTRLHCIGHSLGAHTCGYIGYNLRVQYGYKLSRISGLDPAEPHFSNTSPMVRLDPTDADFVTAIHTDCSPFISGGLGISQPVAHIDFYPNGGRNQPGCNEGVFNSITLEKGSLFRGIKRFLGCNHIRSYEYFIESINTACPFLSVPCTSWEKFQNGSCFDCVEQHCPRFGFNAQPGNYHASTYLMTGREKSFCKAHYRVTIIISKTNESLSYGGEVGMFVIRVIGPNGKTTERMSLSEHSKYYEPGTKHTVVIPGDVVGKVEAVEITWDYQTSMFNPLTWRLLHKPKAYIDSLTIKSLEFHNEITVCPANTKTLVANEPQMLKEENCQYSELNFVAT